MYKVIYKSHNSDKTKMISENNEKIIIHHYHSPFA